MEDDRIREDEVDFFYNFDKIYLDFDHIVFNGDEELGKLNSHLIFSFFNQNVLISKIPPLPRNKRKKIHSLNDVIVTSDDVTQDARI